MNQWFVYDGPDFIKGFKEKDEAEQYIRELQDLDEEGISCLYVVDIEEHRDIQDGEEEYERRYEL